MIDFVDTKSGVVMTAEGDVYEIIGYFDLNGIQSTPDLATYCSYGIIGDGKTVEIGRYILD